MKTTTYPILVILVFIPFLFSSPRISDFRNMLNCGGQSLTINQTEGSPGTVIVFTYIEDISDEDFSQIQVIFLGADETLPVYRIPDHVNQFQTQVPNMLPGKTAILVSGPFSEQFDFNVWQKTESDCEADNGECLSGDFYSFLVIKPLFDLDLFTFEIPNYGSIKFPKEVLSYETPIGAAVGVVKLKRLPPEAMLSQFIASLAIPGDINEPLQFPTFVEFCPLKCARVAISVMHSNALIGPISENITGITDNDGIFKTNVKFQRTDGTLYIGGGEIGEMNISFWVDNRYEFPEFEGNIGSISVDNLYAVYEFINVQREGLLGKFVLSSCPKGFGCLKLAHIGQVNSLDDNTYDFDMELYWSDGQDISFESPIYLKIATQSMNGSMLYERIFGSFTNPIRIGPFRPLAMDIQPTELEDVFLLPVGSLPGGSAIFSESTPSSFKGNNTTNLEDSQLAGSANSCPEDSLLTITFPSTGGEPIFVAPGQEKKFTVTVLKDGKQDPGAILDYKEVNSVEVARTNSLASISYQKVGTSIWEFTVEVSESVETGGTIALNYTAQSPNAPNKAEASNEVKVVTVKFSPDPLKVIEGNTKALEAIVTPSDATTHVKFESADSSKVTVAGLAPNLTVTGVKGTIVGTTVDIRAKVDEKISKTVPVTVQIPTSSCFVGGDGTACTQASPGKPIMWNLVFRIFDQNNHPCTDGAVIVEVVWDLNSETCILKGDPADEPLPQPTDENGNVADPTGMEIIFPNLDFTNGTYQELKWKENKLGTNKRIFHLKTDENEKVTECNLWFCGGTIKKCL